MATSRKSLKQVQEVITTVHQNSTPEKKLQFYDNWAKEYEEDVSVLEYTAPHLVAATIASMYTSKQESKLVLDVACGTGLVAQELKHFGFGLFDGVDGSAGMLQVAKNKNLYQELKQCTLGQEPLPFPTDYYDAVVLVGALSAGHVPVSVIPEIVRVTKTGGFLCFTTRRDSSNLQYKAELECELTLLENTGLWEFVSTQNVEKWEKANSEQEILGKSAYIPGVIYLYKKRTSDNQSG